MNHVLFIDPGTACGYAFRQGSQIVSGTWDLVGNRYEGGGMRYVRLRRFLEDLGDIHAIGFEEVQSMGTKPNLIAAQVYGGIVATIMSYCEEREIPYVGIPISTLKKFGTGKGNAGKPEMIKTARAWFPGQQIKDDNQADALIGLKYITELVLPNMAVGE